MKHKLFLVAVLAVMCASCGTEYVVTDKVQRDLAGTRTILSSDTVSLGNTVCNSWDRQLLAKPQYYDFRVLTDTMRYAYTSPVARGGWTLEDDSLSRMLRPQVSVSKNFRWFTTRYCYMARFPRLDSLPVPIDEYFTSDEAQLLFNHNEWPSDWNGADMYALLDKLNTKYVRWWSHCLFERQYEMFMAQADSTQRQLLAGRHDTLLAMVLADLDDDSQMPLARKASLFPELDFVSDYFQSFEVQAAVSEWVESNAFETHVLWNVDLPGGRSVEHKVSADRLLLGDYIIEETGRTVNWWACILTFLLLVGAAWFILRGAPFGAGRLRSLQD